MKQTERTFGLLLKKRLVRLVISFLIFTAIQCNQELLSQQINEKAGESGLGTLTEQLYFRTDRDIYIAGEKVWFKVYKMNGLTNAPFNLSKVIYVELLDKNNFPLQQLKVKADGNSGSSVFIIPDNLSSGNYLIRAYTNWMKNYPVDMFCFKEISVINPFESIDHIKLPSGNQFSPDSISKLSVNAKEEILNKRNLSGKSEHFNYNITLQKPEYSPREKVKISITATDLAGNPLETDLSVSVAKSAIVNSSVKENTSSAGILANGKNGIAQNEDVPLYLPELEGHLISGYMRLKTTDEPLKKTDLSLSYVGKTARCQFGKTDDNGEFYFLVRESGLNEIVIQPLSPDITGYYMELNQPFSSSFSDARASAFYLDSNRVNAINNAIIGMQIDNIYEPFRQKATAKPKPGVPDFYGKPENTILMSDYIELTSLREVVKEIIPNVHTVKQNGKLDFKLINKFQGQPFENKPLVLVDGIPIYDYEKVLNINSKEIERADVINTRYFYSENVFDGIISFITKKGNLSAIEFDNSIFRQAYEACEVQKDFYSPDYSTDSLKNSRIPDYRNTLCWAPELQTKKDGKAEIEFFTSDESAGYTIVVEGISPDGKTGYSSATFTVK